MKKKHHKPTPEPCPPDAPRRRLTLVHVQRELERLHMTIQELQAAIVALDAKINALPKPVSPVATQADIDAAGAAVAQASADLDASQAPA